MSTNILEEGNIIVTKYYALFRHKKQKVFQVNTCEPPKYIVITEDEAGAICNAIMEELAPHASELLVN